MASATLGSSSVVAECASVSGMEARRYLPGAKDERVFGGARPRHAPHAVSDAAHGGECKRRGSIDALSEPPSFHKAGGRSVTVFRSTGTSASRLSTAPERG